MEQPDGLMTVEEVAIYVKVGKFTVYSWIGDKKLRAFKVGDQWRIKREDLDAFMKSNQQVA
jgi:excisionase family DNA binding protein